MNMKTLVLILVTTTILGGCSSMNIFKDSQEASGPSAEPKEAMLAPEPDDATMAPKGQLSAAQIRKTLSGKSWKWSSPKNNGVTLYADDGSSLVEVTGKGTTTGKWIAKDGQLCESIAPAPFIPKGNPMTCLPMSGGGSTYSVGKATFTLA